MWSLQAVVGLPANWSLLARMLEVASMASLQVGLPEINLNSGGNSWFGKGKGKEEEIEGREECINYTH